jgi:3-hydroxyisobutyrate dehydrogenase-like beta-hydroxyacid dehydrogenase
MGKKVTTAINFPVGFIGLGNMGNPMARNLLMAGFPLVVHDLQRGQAENLLAQGAQWADSPRAVAEQVAVVITMLPHPEAVQAVVSGEEGIAAGLRPGKTWIDCSTNGQENFLALAGRVAESGADVLDAPVTGAVDGAHKGELVIFVGGETAVLERNRPVLAPLAKQIHHAGPLGAGIAAKLLTNLLWFVNACAIGEALMLGAKAGIELPKLWEIIKTSAGNSWVAEHDVPSIFAGHYDPSFTLDLCVKDLRLIHQLARQLRIPLAMGSTADELFRRAQAQYGGDKGEMHVVKLLEEVTGTRLQLPEFQDFTHMP